MLYVRELARHQAALARAEAIEEAVLREGARTPLALGLNLSNRATGEDALLAAAGTSEAIERISRYRRQHERALARSLVALRDLQALTAAPAKRPTPSIGRKFTTEDECERYLVARMRETPFRCPRCGHQSASWLAARRVWQCDECRRQTGLRAGTILERSRVSLLAWFTAIECVIADPGAPLSVIPTAAGLSRLTTVRTMIRRIREAIASSAASERLARLDVYFANRPRAASATAELSVP